MFLIQLFMLFHKVASVLLSMVAFPTTFLLVKILQQPIRIFEISRHWSCHGEQDAGYHVKEHKKLRGKLMSKVTLHFVLRHLSKKKQCCGFFCWTARMTLKQILLPRLTCSISDNLLVIIIEASPRMDVRSTFKSVIN